MRDVPSLRTRGTRRFSHYGSLETFSNNRLFADAWAFTVTDAMLDTIGSLVAKRAGYKLGEYQEQSGHFRRWVELSDLTKEDRVYQGYTENEPLLRSGEMAETLLEVNGRAGYTTHKRPGYAEVRIGSPYEKAVWSELGAPHVPPRPFLGPALYESMPEIRAIVGTTFASTVTTAMARVAGIFGGQDQNFPFDDRGFRTQKPYNLPDGIDVNEYNKLYKSHVQNVRRWTGKVRALGRR